VRKAVRRRSTSPVVRQLQERALAAIGFSRDKIAEWSTPPTVAFHFGLVGHGYQMDMFVEGQYVGSACRDLSDTHKVRELKSSLIEAVAKAVNNWRLKL
jgi:hypothetical protein